MLVTCTGGLIASCTGMELQPTHLSFLQIWGAALNSTRVIDFQGNVTDPASYAGSIGIRCFQHTSVYFKVLSVTVSVHSDPSLQPQLIKLQCVWLDTNFLPGLPPEKQTPGCIGHSSEAKQLEPSQHAWLVFTCDKALKKIILWDWWCYCLLPFLLGGVNVRLIDLVGADKLI